MARILTLGAGVMGTAVCVPLSDNGHEVRLVGTHLDGGIIEAIQQSHQHPGLNAPVPHDVRPYMIQQLEQAFRDIDLVILGVNSLGIRWAADALASYLQSEIPVLLLTKGLEGDGKALRLLPDVFQEHLPDQTRDCIRIAAIGGPSIAGELAARRQTSVIISGREPDLLKSIRDLLQTEYYRISISLDFVGVEVAVGLKNLYAIGIGMVAGLLDAERRADDPESMHNIAATLFTQSAQEMAYLSEIMGGDRETIYNLPGVGDLYVTCQGGRNSRMGRLIGGGLSYRAARAMHMPADTIEGAEIAFAINKTVRQMILEGCLAVERVPLLLTLFDVICEEIPAKSALSGFFVSAPFTDNQ